MRTDRLPAYALVGLFWGLVAWLIGGRAVGPGILAGVVASPLIGVVVGATLHSVFETASWGRRAAIALLSLYCGATMFGLAIGLRDLMVRAPDQSVEVLWEGVVGMWYGTSIFVIALWPLAYLTHAALATDLPWWRRPLS